MPRELPESFFGPGGPSIYAPDSWTGYQDQGGGSSLASLLSPLVGLGNVIGLPRDMILDALAGENPWDQLLTPFSSENRTTGRELLRRWGAVGPENTWGNFASGVLLEEALDPINLATLGVWGATKGGLRQSLKLLGRGGLRQAAKAEQAYNRAAAQAVTRYAREGSEAASRAAADYRRAVAEAGKTARQATRAARPAYRQAMEEAIGGKVAARRTALEKQFLAAYGDPKLVMRPEQLAESAFKGRVRNAATGEFNYVSARNPLDSTAKVDASLIPVLKGMGIKGTKATPINRMSYGDAMAAMQKAGINPDALVQSLGYDAVVTPAAKGAATVRVIPGTGSEFFEHAAPMLPPQIGEQVDALRRQLMAQYKAKTPPPITRPQKLPPFAVPQRPAFDLEKAIGPRPASVNVPAAPAWLTPQREAFLNRELLPQHWMSALDPVTSRMWPLRGRQIPFTDMKVGYTPWFNSAAPGTMAPWSGRAAAIPGQYGAPYTVADLMKLMSRYPIPQQAAIALEQ